MSIDIIEFKHVDGSDVYLEDEDGNPIDVSDYMFCIAQAKIDGRSAVAELRVTKELWEDAGFPRDAYIHDELRASLRELADSSSAG
jgi:hypothetical protein